MVRPERFELPTPWFVARYSIQLSYGRVDAGLYLKIPSGMAEREGFEPSIRFWAIYTLSRGAPSTTRPSLLKNENAGKDTCRRERRKAA